MSASKKSEPNPWLLLGAGFELAGLVVILTLLGYWLDTRWQTSPWLLLTGATLGCIGGFYQLWQLARRFF